MAINTALNHIMPPMTFQFGNWSISMSPNIAIGGGKIGTGFNFTAGFDDGNFGIAYGFGISQSSNFVGKKVSGVEFRNSFMGSWSDGTTTLSLGTNIWGGTGDLKKYAQQTGIISIKSGEFSISYENDGAPFGKGKVFGDNHDRYRTAGLRVSIGEFSAGFNLFTGARYSSSYEETLGGEDASTMSGRKKYGFWGRLFRSFLQADNGGFKARLPFGTVKEEGTQYRFGALYVGYGNYRIGINSDRHVRHPIQDIFAHYFLSPQPGFQTLTGGLDPYISLQTNNSFTSW